MLEDASQNVAHVQADTLSGSMRPPHLLDVNSNGML